MKQIAPLLVLSMLLFVGCSDLTTNPDSPAPEQAREGPTATAHGAHKLPPATRQELAQVRQATKQYHDAEQALADGYVPSSAHVPGMGIHYLNPGLVDGTFEKEKPELLVYVDRGNHRKLVAVEYAVPVPLSEDPPEGFTGDADKWHVHEAACHYVDGTEIHEEAEGDCPDRNPNTGAELASWHPDLWTLHAWVWLGNPQGIFNETNPNVE